MSIPDNIKFPSGLFFSALALFTVCACASAAGYLLYAGKKGVRDIEQNTRTHYSGMVEALAGVAELSYGGKDFSTLEGLARKKADGDEGMEAFLVLADGTIAMHSDSAAREALLGNIATDEFAYNRDLILLPLQRNGKEALVLDYNIMGKRIPFSRDQRKLIKRFLYPGIDRPGWLITRAVFHGGKPVATMNIILGKDKVYRFLAAHFLESAILLAALLAMSLFASLATTLLAYRRLKSAASFRLAGGRPLGAAQPAPVPHELSRELSALEDDARGIRDAIPIVK